MKSQFFDLKKSIFGLKRVSFRFEKNPFSVYKKSNFDFKKNSRRHSAGSLFISRIALLFHEPYRLEYHSHNTLNNNQLQLFLNLNAFSLQ